MRILISIFLSTIFCWGQQTLLTDNFDNFYPRIFSASIGYYQLDSVKVTNYLQDQTGKVTGSLTENGDIPFTVDNPWYSGGKVPRFNFAASKTNYFSIAGNNHFNPPNGDWTIITFLQFDTSSVTVSSHFAGRHDVWASQGWRLWAEPTLPNNNEVLFKGRSSSHDLRNEYTGNSIEDDEWFIFMMDYYGNPSPTLDSSQVYKDGIFNKLRTYDRTTDSTGSVQPFMLGAINDAVANWSGSIAFFGLVKRRLTSSERKEIGFLANGWISQSGGVIRVDSSDVWKFHQGVISDTVYFDSLLITGLWEVTLDIDGNSGGETYQLLTSSDKTTWSSLSPLNLAPINNTTKTFQGRGKGYLGLAVSSVADTVFFDNLVLTLKPVGFSLSKKRKTLRNRRFTR